jgi:anaerobic ribonucleoside-triphosphate reductase activating protein
MISGISKLNVANEMSRSVVNGPGCFNESYQPLIEQKLVEVDSLAAKILSSKGIEGVTYSGGEPMLQARALYQLNRILKEHGLTVMCYSGYTLDQLQQKGDPDISGLLSTLDILVDGPFILEKKRNLMWRGSSNQKVYFLTEVYSQYESRMGNNVSEMEISIGQDNMVITGMLEEKIIQRLNQVMNANDFKE